MLKPDQDSYRDLGTGFILGLYEDPVEGRYDCPACNKFGADLAQTHEDFVRVFKIKDRWIDKNRILDMSLFKMLGELLYIYPFFSDFFFSFIGLMQNPALYAFMDEATAESVKNSESTSAAYEAGDIE